MTVQITPKSTQHTGLALSTGGSVAAWQVTFQLEGGRLTARCNIYPSGGTTHAS